MTQKKSYSRYFIILQEDEKGYALGSDKLPSGYAKLEIKNDKCKVSYYVQNLKKESAPYFMVLICGKKDVKKIIKIGELNIDEHGRTEVSYEYAVENVANCNVGVDKIIGAAIVRFMNTNIIPVMSGFTSTEIPEWKAFVVVEEDKKRNDSEDIVKPEAVPEVKTEVKAESVVKEDINTSQRNIFDDYEAKIEEEKSEEIKLLPVEEEPIEVESANRLIEIEAENKVLETEEEYCHEEDTRHHKKCNEDKYEIKHEAECKEEKRHEHKCKNEKEDMLKGIMGGFFKDLIDGFEELEDYCYEIKRCKWYKVPINRIEDLHSCPNYHRHTVVYYPMLNYFPYIGKHKHFILGYKFDKDNKMKFLIYGIPGRRNLADQPYGGRTGFVTWVPLTPGEEEEHHMGYWLMFYDYKNSTIVVPVR